MLNETMFNKEYLLLGKYFAKGETCCIVAKPGVGKTFTALQIAKNPLIKKNAYFELDDGFRQNERLNQIAAIHPIYLSEFEVNLERIKKKLVLNV